MALDQAGITLPISEGQEQSVTSPSGLTKDAKSPPFHHSERDKNVTLHSEAAGRTGPTDGKLLNGGAAYFASPPTARRGAPATLPTAVCTLSAALQQGTSSRGIFKHLKTKHRLQEKKTPALILHLVMQEEAAADFLLERAIVFLLDTDRWRLSLRSWKQVISSPSFALSSPTCWARLLLALGPRQTLHCAPRAALVPSGGCSGSPAAPGLTGASSPSSHTTKLKNSHNFPSSTSGATIISAFAGKINR